jgi:hypothetical protein
MHTYSPTFAQTSKVISPTRLLPLATRFTFDGWLFAAAFAVQPWTTFGGTCAVKTGEIANPWAIQLSSACPKGVPACFADGSFTSAGILFRPPEDHFTFAGIVELSADYKVKRGDCGAGSPRFQIDLDMNGDGATIRSIQVYFGPVPKFTNCSSTWQNTGNLIGNEQVEFDTTQLATFTPHDTYAHARSLVGARKVVGIRLVVDSGWFPGDKKQVFWFDNVTVNHFALTANRR